MYRIISSMMLAATMVAILSAPTLGVGDHPKQYCDWTVQWDCRKSCEPIGQYGSWKVVANGEFIRLCKPSSNWEHHCCTEDVICGTKYTYPDSSCGTMAVSADYRGNRCFQTATQCPTGNPSPG